MVGHRTFTRLYGARPAKETNRAREPIFERSVDPYRLALRNVTTPLRGRCDILPRDIGPARANSIFATRPFAHRCGVPPARSSCTSAFFEPGRPAAAAGPGPSFRLDPDSRARTAYGPSSRGCSSRAGPRAQASLDPARSARQPGGSPCGESASPASIEAQSGHPSRSGERHAR